MAGCKDTHPDVDAYIENAAEFARPILREIRAAFHEGCPDVEERIKWGCPSFERGGMLGGMASFNQHVGYGFWNGRRMKDPEGLFGGDPKSSPMRIKVADVADLPSRAVLVAYVKEAARLNEEGVKPKRKKVVRKPKESVEAPDDLMDAVNGSARARATWEGFSYSKRKEYVEWITTAKREATREKRLRTAIEWIAEGKDRNWKYR